MGGSLASFVTTYMEEEAEKLMIESFSKNFIDYEEYPVSAGRTSKVFARASSVNFSKISRRDVFP